MIFESHAHYDDEAFDEDRKELLDALPAQGIGRVINVCAEVEGWDRTVDLMERYPYIYGAVGVHPDDVGALDEEKIQYSANRKSNNRNTAGHCLNNYQTKRLIPC